MQNNATHHLQVLVVSYSPFWSSPPGCTVGYVQLLLYVGLEQCQLILKIRHQKCYFEPDFELLLNLHQSLATDEIIIQSKRVLKKKTRG